MKTSRSLNADPSFSERMYATLYENALKITTEQREKGVYIVGWNNWLNGKASAMFAGEFDNCRSIIMRQKRFAEKILGLVVQIEEESFITFGIAPVSDTLFSISMALIPDSQADRYRSIKENTLRQGVPFKGIVDQEIGDTDIFTPLAPDSDKFPDYNKAPK